MRYLYTNRIVGCQGWPRYLKEEVLKRLSFVMGFWSFFLLEIPLSLFIIFGFILS